MVSLSVSEIILEYVCPAAGMVCANWMFMAPLADVRKAETAGRLADLNPTPWAVMLGNTLGWVSYGLLRSNWFIFFANAPGFLLSLYFNLVAMKLLYADIRLANVSATTTTIAPLLLSTEYADKHDSSEPAKEVDLSPSAALTDPSSTTLMATAPAAPTPNADSTEAAKPCLSPAAAIQNRLQSHERLVLFMVVLWMGVLTCLIAAESWDDDTRQMFLGLVVNCNLIFFYGAPLSIIRQVLTTQSSRWLHGPTMLRNTANGVFWAAYGIAVLDPYVALPNGLGALLGVVQMILWVIFPRGGDNANAPSSLLDEPAQDASDEEQGSGGDTTASGEP